MTPDEAVDAVMRGPFDGIGRHDHVFEPPSAEVEASMRAFLRALVEARPGVVYDAGYDAMHGITVEVGEEATVSVIMWNGSTHACLCGPTGTSRGMSRTAPFAESASLVPEVLARIDLAALREAAK